MQASAIELPDDIVRVERKERFRVVNSDYVRNGERFAKIFDSKLKRERLVKDDLIIKFKKDILIGDVYYYLSRKNLELVKDLGSNTFLCKPIGERNNTKLLRAINSLNAQNLNEASEDYNYDDEALNEMVALFDVNEYKKIGTSEIWTNPLAKKAWHLDNDGRNGLIAGADINVEDAWNYTHGEGVKIAVIDTGFDTGHKDINYYKQGFNALSYGGEIAEVSSAVAGSTDDAMAPKFSNENHGTAVAGIISAKDNDMGVVGVAPSAEVIPIRLINDTGSVSVAQIVAAFRKAQEMGAQIINNSWGSRNPNLEDGEIFNVSDIERDLYIDVAKNGNNGKGIIVMFASGNSGSANFNNSPEARIPEVVAVGATDSTDQRVAYSVFGPELDIVAPGGGYKTIITTDRRDLKSRKGKRKVTGYSKGSYAKGFRGTSAATPVAAGVAALIWSINPNLNADEVKEIMYKSAIKIKRRQYEYQDGKDLQMGHGRVDAARAVELALQSFY